jgi:ketosteroid isomerase-like protein
MNPETEFNHPDQASLSRLNREYVDAFMNADVEWYRRHLADEFVVIESDGTVLNKEQFLTNTAKGPDVREYELQEVDIRLYGSTGLVRATGVWTRADGTMGMSRYIDVYVKHDTGWRTVSAQITRSPKFGPRGAYKRPRRRV